MAGEKDKIAVKVPPDDGKDGKHIQAQAQAQSDTEPFDVPTVAALGSAPVADIGGPSLDLKKASDDLKKRIDEEKRRHDMPVDSNLGDPSWEERAADGHLDRPDDDDE
jgi:hypothetical protein